MIESERQSVSRFETAARMRADKNPKLFSITMFQSCSKDMFTRSFIQFVF